MTQRGISRGFTPLLGLCPHAPAEPRASALPLLLTRSHSVLTPAISGIQGFSPSAPPGSRHDITSERPDWSAAGCSAIGPSPPARSWDCLASNSSSAREGTMMSDLLQGNREGVGDTRVGMQEERKGGDVGKSGCWPAYKHSGWRLMSEASFPLEDLKWGQSGI